METLYQIVVVIKESGETYSMAVNLDLKTAQRMLPAYESMAGAKSGKYTYSIKIQD